MTLKKLGERPTGNTQSPAKPTKQPLKPYERSPISYGFEFAFGFWLSTFLIFGLLGPAIGCLLALFIPGLFSR